MLRNAWLIPLIPAVSFFLILFFGKRLPKRGAEIGVLLVGLSFVLSCITLVQWIDRVESSEGRSETAAAESHSTEDTGAAAEAGAEEHEQAPSPVSRSVTWLQSGGDKFDAGTQMDGLAVIVTFVVCLVSFLVHVYSVSYMEGDRRFTYFFAALSLFTASMLLLVVANNTLQMLVGWELVGLCSFMLIGHWWEEKPNSDAALKAFLTTRVGDIGLICGIVILFWGAGRTFDIVTLNEKALNGDISHLILLVGSCALFAGVVGKSGQFPLHTWLPDAMAGPTPVSALIHAATMVVAGVYLVARLYGVFWQGMSIHAGGVNLMAAIGGFTVLMAAALAFVQDDIKKVLAYSTISQLGYMIMGLGVGAWVAAIFHLFTHAFFKALLFLGSGSVSHAVHSFDMKKDMGGLRKPMPQTFWTFIIGSLALAGIFPLAGFWSKDEILLGAGENGYSVFLWVGLIGAFMTAAYMTRCVYLTFYGEYRGHGHPHESPKLITVPLWTLAVLSVGAGLLNAPGIEKFTKWVEPTGLAYFPPTEHHDFSVPAALKATVVALGAITVGILYWWRNFGPHRFTERNRLASAGNTFLVNKYYLDHLYTGIVVGNIKGPIAQGAYWVNQNVIDGAVNAVGIGSRKAADWTYDQVDQRVVDGIVNAAGAGAEGSGGLLRHLQTGRVQEYASLLFGGAVLLGAALVIFI
jgi:NADH-quinone oxidoreductase subunit L